MIDCLGLQVAITGRGEMRYRVEGMTIDRVDLLAWLRSQRETGRFDDGTPVELAAGTLRLALLEELLGALAPATLHPRDAGAAAYGRLRPANGPIIE